MPTLTLLLPLILRLLVVVTWCHAAASASTASSATAAAAHNNWAVIVDTSRFWFNYRHIANALSVYRTVKRLGIPDENIILMLADDVACNPRNRRPASVISNAKSRQDLYGPLSVEVDYRGYDVSVENFIRLLTGRHDASVPASKRLRTDHESRILIYMTGHGGDGFIKFQDSEEIGSEDLADAFAQMHEAHRYKEILFMVDTCQASTLYRELRSPNILAISSSLLGENSYSHHRDFDLGVTVIDSFTHYVLDFFKDVYLGSTQTVGDLMASLDPKLLLSTPHMRTDLFGRSANDTLLTDFFGSVPYAKLDTRATRIKASWLLPGSKTFERAPKEVAAASSTRDSGGSSTVPDSTPQMTDLPSHDKARAAWHLVFLIAPLLAILKILS